MKKYSSTIEEGRKKLAYYGHLLGLKGLTFSSFGNISLRIKDKVIIKKKGVNLELAQAQDFSVLPLRRNLYTQKELSYVSSEWRMHILTYRAHPGYNAIFHLHPFYILLLEELNLKLASPDLEFQYLLKDKIGYLPPLEPGTEELAEKVARSLKRYPFVILKKHGIVVAGENIEIVYNCSLAAEIVAKKIIYLSLLKKNNM